MIDQRLKLLVASPCPMCGGTGHIDNAIEVGNRMREQRWEHDLTIAKMARRMGVSQPYLSDLELGKRRWTPAMIERYERALSE